MQNHKFDKKPAKTSMKPLDLSCILRVSQSQQAESGFRDAIVELLYDGLLDAMQAQSHSAAFPETALPAILQLKQFIKKCPLPSYTKKMKQLLDKIQENVKFVEKYRAGVHFELADTQAVMALENQMKAAGTPLTTYHGTWKKMRDREMAIKIAKKPDNDREVNVPVMKKPKAAKSQDDSDDDDSDDGRGDFDELFPSDLSDEDEDDENRFLLKEERGKKRKTEDQEDEQLLVKKKKENAADKAKSAAAAKKAKAAAAAAAAAASSDSESDGQDAGDEVVDFDMSSGDEGQDDEDSEEAGSGSNEDESDEDDD